MSTRIRFFEFLAPLFIQINTNNPATTACEMSAIPLSTLRTFSRNIGTYSYPETRHCFISLFVICALAHTMLTSKQMTLLSSLNVRVATSDLIATAFLLKYYNYVQNSHCGCYPYIKVKKWILAKQQAPYEVSADLKWHFASVRSAA